MGSRASELGQVRRSIRNPPGSWRLGLVEVASSSVGMAVFGQISTRFSMGKGILRREKEKGEREEKKENEERKRKMEEREKEIF